MAKKDEQKAKSNGNGASKGRPQIFVAGFAVEGGDSVLADGFKAIRDLTEAMKSSGVLLAPAPRQKGALAASSAGAASTPVVEDEDEEIEQQGVVVESEDVEAEDAAEEETTNSSGPKRAYSFKAPKFMDDLDFSTASKSLEAFMVEKGNPTEITDKYLVTVVWFKDFMNIEEVTVHHIFTAFDHANWKAEIPANPTIPLRDLKGKRHMLTRESGAEGYKLNFKGIQHVEKMK
jgi:hypothetical protein